MKEDSEEARLMGNNLKSSSMVYTDGPRLPLTDLGPARLPMAPPDYEKATMGNTECHDDRLGRHPERSSVCASEASQDSEQINELINYSGTTLMTQFHADAMKQVGFGKYQGLMILVAGLAVTSQTAQIFSLFFALPSTNLEFCMVPHRKYLLIAVNFMGAAFGALNISAIAEMNGRKRTLLTCLIIMTLFSIVSAFMPTYEPFSMARFCASVCAGAILPIAVTYIAETVPGNMRGRTVGLLIILGLTGALFAGAVSALMLPMSGEQLMLEDREHFSSWHRYLLVIALFPIPPIIGLLALPESPRWLLDVGREVEALETYQKMYCVNRKDSKYTLTELELPGMRSERHATPKSVLTTMANNAYQFCDSISSLMHAPYRKTTYILAAIWFLTLLICYGVSIYILKYGHSLEEQLFHAGTIKTLSNTFENITLTTNIVNQKFVNCHFINSTFEQIFLIYVNFQNCTFIDTNFHGVKTGNTTFVNTFFKNVKFIDTDLDEQNLINCTKNKTLFYGIPGSCDQQFDFFNIISMVEHNFNVRCIFPSVILVVCASENLNRLGRIRMATLCLVLASIICCIVPFICDMNPIYLLVGGLQGAIFAGLLALTVFSVEYYCTYLRCTALGLFVCCGYFGALIGEHIYSRLPAGNAHIPAFAAAFGLSVPSILTTFLRDSSHLL